MMNYSRISEIVNSETGEVVPPLEEWDITVIDRDLSEEIGDIGGREVYVVNARVRVTEEDGSTWEGFAHIE